MALIRPPVATPAVAVTRSELDKLLDGPGGSRGLVMTMGALHEGHAELIRAARARLDADARPGASAGQLVVSIFVNPLQFGPNEDLARYPRTLDADLALCAAEGVDVVYAPDVVHDETPLVRVSSGAAGTILEGAVRPGHFDGVLTIVATVFHLVRPDFAVFGRKDAQQFALVRRMVRDLAFGVEIVGVPTAREPDGLARSSRNRFLDPPARAAALALPRALDAGRRAQAAGADPDGVIAAARAVLAAEAGVSVDYVALADADTFGPPRPGQPRLLLLAARVGTTRLIDNLELAS